MIGCHDSGYFLTLQNLFVQDPAFRDKVILLPGYTKVEKAFDSLRLPCLQTEGLFLSEKLTKKGSASRASSPMKGSTALQQTSSTIALHNVDQDSFTTSSIISIHQAGTPAHNQTTSSTNPFWLPRADDAIPQTKGSIT